MDYPFETLSPETFQQFCQALIAKEFPDVICLPVGQPDGGRDAFWYLEGSATSKFIVFQVKFVRKPFAEDAPHDWLIRVLEDEAPKIKRLLPRGASKYYLLTNVPGTAHLDVGSIDRVKAILKRELPLPAECWWRDDLARRLDAATDLKWSYPQLLSGIDILRQLVESGLSEHKERRARAVRLFLRDQYETEKEVRFKQVELQNRLSDLFIDVPVALRDVGDSKARRLVSNILQIVGSEYELDENDVIYQRAISERDDKSFTGAASFLLHHLTQERLPDVVLEGAPGQGKSTITQYICQVHRMRLLNETAELQRLTEQHRTSPIRFPMRVDLRDLATWFSKKNPFSADDNDPPPSTWSKTLDSFLAALISQHSGGEEFSVADLHAVVHLTALLLVFDGLDEVADIVRRHEIVDEITKGINRLRDLSASLQVIITSRPAAFANSPGFPTKSFPHCQLENLTRPLILEYAERWLQARKLQGRESAEVRTILKEKLDQPHLRDLAKNPMQLTILLSLIHNRGSSLPDKRTELYDSYVDLFFSREAQKSSVVRERRDLLINIHRYLAWVLHFEAEEGKRAGSISAERLEKLLFEYLSQEGYDTSLVKELFTGMVERVVALVSRVEGTYEFEVQPLREYFAARYLYVTAPYSPPGSPKQGNKLDRFDAISRNFYWLNVTRFYAGCFDIGELPSLADRLEELTKEDGYRHTNHPRYLAATLLTDWVFAQHPKSLRHVVTLLVDGLGLRLLLAANSRRYRVGRLGASELLPALPKQCGKDELMDKCFQMLRANPVPDYANDIIELIKANADPLELSNLWIKEIYDVTGRERSRWIQYGFYLGVLPHQAADTLERIMEDLPAFPQCLRFIYRARRIEFLERSEERVNSLINGILDRNLTSTGPRKTESVIDSFAESLNVYRYSCAFNTRQTLALSNVSENTYRFANLSLDIPSEANWKIYEKCRSVISVAIEESQRPSSEWATNIAPWNTLVETVRNVFGNRWISMHIANVAAGIRSIKETCSAESELLDDSRALCRRVRYARLRAGQSKWWESQFELQKNTDWDRVLVCLIFITWAKSNTLLQLITTLNAALEGLSASIWDKVAQLAQAVPSYVRSTREPHSQLDANHLPNDLSPRCVAALGLRVKSETAKIIHQRYLTDYDGNDPFIWRFCIDATFSRLREDPSNWSTCLKLIEESYGKRQLSDWPSRIERTRVIDSIPTDAAKQIAEHPDKYPGWLVNLAETACRKDVASRIIPVGRIAKQDQWFSN